jgi:hypothetical protein
MNTILSAFVVVGLVIVAILLLIFGPFVTIWSLNTLFPALAIPYTFSTWLAVIWLGMAVRGNTYTSTKS